MNSKDNVVTCVREVEKGEKVVYRDGDVMKTIEAQEQIPYCHKVALVDLQVEEVVLKYGEMIGKTRNKVDAGHWVSHENIYSVPRDYESELI